VGSGWARIGTPVVCQIHEIDQQVGPHVARGPTSVLIHNLVSVFRMREARSTAAKGASAKADYTPAFVCVSSGVDKGMRRA
jgi:hypothetical protein